MGALRSPKSKVQRPKSSWGWQTLDFGPWTLDSLLDFGLWTLDSLLDFGPWTLDALILVTREPGLSCLTPYRRRGSRRNRNAGGMRTSPDLRADSLAAFRQIRAAPGWVQCRGSCATL